MIRPLIASTLHPLPPCCEWTAHQRLAWLIAVTRHLAGATHP